MKMPPTERTILEPEGGWKEQTYYVVDIAWRSTNPIHRRILYIGFLNGAKGRPFSGGYTCLLGSDELENAGDSPERAYYLKPVCEIPEMEEKP